MIAYLPCELKARDLDSRLLVASHLLKRHISVVIGQRWSIIDNIVTMPTGRMPKGVALMTTASAVQCRDAALRFHSAGHGIVACDEEALALCSPGHMAANVDPLMMTLCDRFVVQSPAHAEALKDGHGAHPESVAKIEVVGSARADLVTQRYRGAYADEASDILKAHGKFILFNSNFALTHYIWGDVDALGREKALKRGLRIDMLDWERENMRLFIDVAKWAASELHGFKVVIRPHPAEAIGAWSDLLGDDRIVVVENTLPQPWLMAAEAVVHTNCATGLEAAMLGRPCLNISPDPEAEWHNAFVVKDLSWTVRTAGQAKAALLEMLAARMTTPTEAVDKHLPGWGDGTAAEKVAAVVADVMLRACASGSGASDKMTWQRTSRGPNQRHKFTLSHQEIDARLPRFARLARLRGQVATVELDDSVFLLIPRPA